VKEIPLASTPRDGSLEDGAEAVPPGWVAQDAFRMLSMAFSIKSEDERFSESLRWHLAPFLLDAPASASIPSEFLTTDETGEQVFIFRFATDERFRVAMLAEAIHRAVWELHRAVHSQVGDFLLLHAGAVVRDGLALLLPAETASGKSSLTLGLLEKGASYLSDDLAALDPVTNRAYPFPKRIKLIPDALEFFPGLEERLGDRDLPFSQFERFVRPEDVDASVAEPATVKWIVFPTSDFEGTPVLEPIAKAESVKEMAANCLNLYRFGDAGVVLLSWVAKEAEAFRLSGGSLRERIELVSDQLR
jgi:hypothetical protein